MTKSSKKIEVANYEVLSSSGNFALLAQNIELKTISDVFRYIQYGPDESYVRELLEDGALEALTGQLQSSDIFMGSMHASIVDNLLAYHSITLDQSNRAKVKELLTIYLDKSPQNQVDQKSKEDTRNLSQLAQNYDDMVKKSDKLDNKKESLKNIVQYSTTTVLALGFIINNFINGPNFLAPKLVASWLAGRVLGSLASKATYNKKIKLLNENNSDLTKEWQNKQIDYYKLEAQNLMTQEQNNEENTVSRAQRVQKLFT